MVNLRKHQQFEHEGISHAWNQCEFRSKTKSNLKSHKQSKHSNIEYSCKQCDYQTDTKINFKRHQKYTNTLITSY